MMKRTKEENQRLQEFFQQYRHQLQDLQAVQPDLPSEAQRLISGMHSLATETDKAMASYKSLWETYSSLPGTPR